MYCPTPDWKNETRLGKENDKIRKKKREEGRGRMMRGIRSRNGRLDGWMDGWTDGWTKERTKKRTKKRTNGEERIFQESTVE